MCDNNKVIKVSLNDSPVLHSGNVPSEKAAIALYTFTKWWKDPINQVDKLKNIIKLPLSIHIAFNEALWGFGLESGKKNCDCSDCRFLMKVRKQLQ